MNTLLTGTGRADVPGGEVEYDIHLIVAEGSGTAVEVVTGKVDGQRFELQRPVAYVPDAPGRIDTDAAGGRWTGFAHWSRSMTEQACTPLLPLRILSIRPGGPERVVLDGPVRSALLSTAIAGHADALRTEAAALCGGHDAWAVVYRWSADQQWYDAEGVLRMPVRQRAGIFSVHETDGAAMDECRTVRRLVRDMRPTRGTTSWDPSYWSRGVAGWMGSVWGWAVMPVNADAAARLVSWHTGMNGHTEAAAAPELSLDEADERAEYATELADAAEAMAESYWRDQTRVFDDKRSSDAEVAAMFAAMSEGM